MGSRRTSIDREWRQWIAEHKMRRVEDGALVAHMVRNGIDRRAAAREVAAAARHPYVEAGAEKARDLQRLEDLLDVYRSLEALSDERGTVARRRRVTRREFLRDYYSRNRPLVVTGAMRGWKARSRWTPEYLKARYGHVAVEITADREADPACDRDLEGHRRTLLLRDYVDLVVRGGATNDYYLVARNEALRRGGLRALLDDVGPCPAYVEARSPEQVRLWFGPAGTVSRLHCDTTNVLMAQVRGRKRVWMIPSSQIRLVYPLRSGNFSPIDCEHPDHESYPAFRDATVLELVIEPGEMLFIPVGWWHQVKALDVSISLSLVGFAFPNVYR